MAGDERGALADAPVEKRADTEFYLPGLFRPADRLPSQHKVAERLDPFVRRRLLAPQLEQVHAPLRIEADHHVHGVVAAAGSHGVVGGAVGAQVRRNPLGDAKPVGLEILPFLRSGALLIERRPGAGYRLNGVK